MGVVRDRSDCLGEVVGRLDDVGVTGLDSLSLQVQVNALLLGLALLDSVLLDTVDELLTGAGVGDVLDTDVEALLEVAVTDTLVDDDADGGLGHVVDDTGLAVVVLVGQTAANFSICFSSCSIFCFRLFSQFVGEDRISLTPSERHRCT